MQGAVAKIEELSAAIKELQTTKEIEARKVDVDAFNAETNRIKATAEAMTPEQVQAIVLSMLQQLATTPDISPGTGQDYDMPMDMPMEQLPEQPMM